MDELYELMRAYFKECEKSLESAKGARFTKIANIADMCVAIGLQSRREFDDMIAGTEEQMAFYNEVIMRYQSLVDRYVMLGYMKADQYKLLAPLFARQAGGDKTGIVVVFPEWNAPDEWEDFKEIIALCSEKNVTLRRATEILREALE